MRVLWSLFLAIGPFLSGQSVRAQETHTVLTALQATYSIASTLAEGTHIRVLNVPPQGAMMESQAFALSRTDETVFRDAEAVVTIGKLWRDDPLFPIARSHNLHIVNIDAAFPWSATASGIAVMRRPVNNVAWSPAESGDPGLSRYMWLSPTNAVRMAELVAADFSRLSPADALRIAANLGGFSQSMREFKANYGGRVARLADPRVFSLAEEFVYLYSDLGVLVEGWFIKQDVNWTAADYDALSSYLKEHEVQVVVHKWQPDAKIAAAINGAGAKLVVLDAGDPGAAAHGGTLPPRGYQDLMRANMDALLGALSIPKR